MQEGCVDYYEEGGGCCLHCPNAKKGCLCFECKCTKCYWYDSPQQTGDYKGWCGMVSQLKEQRKEEFKNKLQIQEDIKFEKVQRLNKINKKIKEEIIKSQEIPNWYMCMKCYRLFCSKEIFVIKKKEPLCYICKSEEENGI